MVGFMISYLIAFIIVIILMYLIRVVENRDYLLEDLYITLIAGIIPVCNYAGVIISIYLLVATIFDKYNITEKTVLIKSNKNKNKNEDEDD